MRLFSNDLPLGGLALPPVSFCHLNVSSCDVSETSSKFVVIVHNSLARSIDKYVRLPVPASASGVGYKILDPEGNLIEHLFKGEIKYTRSDGFKATLWMPSWYQWRIS